MGKTTDQSATADWISRINEYEFKKADKPKSTYSSTGLFRRKQGELSFNGRSPWGIVKKQGREKDKR